MTTFEPRPTTLLPRARIRRGSTYTVEVSSGWDATSEDWGAPSTPFQHPAWLGSWYSALSERSDLTPVLVTVRKNNGGVAARLPLVLRRSGRLRVIEFADLDLTDYNAPVLGPEAPRGRREAVRLIRAVRRSLPAADLLRLAKMPRFLHDQYNPLALLPGAVPCALNGNVVHMENDYDAWRYGLTKTVRKELERSWRVFTKSPGARFSRVTAREAAHEVISALSDQQGRRMRSLGAAYVLDEPALAEVYHGVVERGIADGTAVVTVLTAGDEIVAALLGLRNAYTYIMIRISQAGGRWANCSPGRLIIERTMALLHADGCRVFDFSVGNYDYKRRFGVVPLPLVDYVMPLSWRGISAATRAGLVGNLRNYPRLDSRLRNLHDWFGSREYGLAAKARSRTRVTDLERT